MMMVQEYLKLQASIGNDECALMNYQGHYLLPWYAQVFNIPRVVIVAHNVLLVPLTGLQDNR